MSIQVLQTESRERCFFTSYENFEDREFIDDLRASLHMMSKSDLTPEEKETIRKSKGPSVTVTANGTTHTREEATVSVCALDMSVKVQLLKESPAVLSLGKLCEENSYSYEWLRCSHRISSRVGENRMYNRQPHSFCCPRRASNRSPDPCSG